MKSILVHLDASPRSAARLALAQRLAGEHGAELQVLYGVVPTLLASAWTSGEGAAAAASFMADQDRDQRARARACFDAARARGGRLSWLDGGATPYLALLQHAPYADLLVLGQTDPEDTMTGAQPPDLVAGSVIDTGKPALVLPHTGTFEGPVGTALIAWKPGREAARAVAGALPWLRAARHLHLAARPATDGGAFDHLQALRHWLQLQGVAAPAVSHALGAGDIGEALLSLAADTGAELLVMGCYGHSRLREWVLGGATRSVLQSMTLPVLMAH